MDKRTHELQSSYNEVAEEYATRFFHELEHKPSDRQLLEQFAQKVRGVGLVCDLGCGPGHIARYLSEQGVDVFGIDLSPTMVEMARQLNPDIKFQQGNMLALNALDEAWAGIVAFYSLIHIPRDKVVYVLRELRRILLPGGFLLLSFHIGNQVIHLDEWWNKPVSIDAYFFSLQEMQDYLTQAGFEIQQSIERSADETIEYPSQRGYILSQKALNQN